MKNLNHYKKAILKKHVGKGGPFWNSIGNGVRNTINGISNEAGNLINGAENGITKGIVGFLGNSPAGKKLQAGLANQGLMKKNSFTPTAPLGKASPSMMQTLQKEAPETLKAPNPSQFYSTDAYNEAKNKFSKYGNWASNK